MLIFIYTYGEAYMGDASTITTIEPQYTPGNLIRVAAGYAIKIFTRTSSHDLRDIQMSTNG